MIIHPRGSYNSPVWVVKMRPSDEELHNYMAFSGTEGWELDKLINASGIRNVFMKVICNDTKTIVSDDEGLKKFLMELEIRKPPIIVTMGEAATAALVPETCKFIKKTGKSICQLDKWAGSILKSPKISWPHCIIPSWDVKYIWMNWAYRDILINIDFGHIREEKDYYEKFGKLQPTPQYEFITEPSCADILSYVNSGMSSPYISNDIETIRPPKSSLLYGVHCGYPYVQGIAVTPTSGMSFSYWDYKPDELIQIWKALDGLFTKVPQIGQNFFLFDKNFLTGLGFNIQLSRCHDTRIRHHILWPELPHSLQFQVKQYTRQAYYKDEGKQWSPKKKRDLMRYNILDVCCTYEVFLKQEEEFNDRPHLR